MASTPIKAVVFDLDGVYFENGTKVFIKKLQDSFGLSEDQIADVYFRSDEMQKYKRGEIDGEAFWKFATAKWGISATKDEIVDMLISSYEQKQAAVNAVSKLKKAGVKVAICTNNFPERLNGLDEKFGLRKTFDVVVGSFEEGVTKPSKEIFDILCDKLGVKPGNIVIGDDREETISELKKLGFVAVFAESLDDFLVKLRDLRIFY